MSKNLPKSVWDQISDPPLFHWATPARNVNGTVPLPWRCAPHREDATAWLQKVAGQPDVYAEYSPSKWRGREQTLVGLRGYPHLGDRSARLAHVFAALKAQGVPVRFPANSLHVYLVDDLDHDAVEAKANSSLKTTGCAKSNPPKEWHQARAREDFENAVEWKGKLANSKASESAGLSPTYAMIAASEALRGYALAAREAQSAGQSHDKDAGYRGEDAMREELRDAAARLARSVKANSSGKKQRARLPHGAVRHFDRWLVPKPSGDRHARRMDDAASARRSLQEWKGIARELGDTSDDFSMERAMHADALAHARMTRPALPNPEYRSADEIRRHPAFRSDPERAVENAQNAEMADLGVHSAVQKGDLAQARKALARMYLNDAGNASIMGLREVAASLNNRADEVARSAKANGSGKKQRERGTRAWDDGSGAEPSLGWAAHYRKLLADPYRRDSEVMRRAHREEIAEVRKARRSKPALPNGRIAIHSDPVLRDGDWFVRAEDPRTGDRLIVVARSLRSLTAKVTKLAAKDDRFDGLQVYRQIGSGAAGYAQKY